jgi:bacteriocin biosynthesis cyclodehydratase domain-containing protein
MARYALAPGLRVLPRSRDEIQIGLTPRRRLRLRRTPALDRVLGALDRGEAVPTDDASRQALQALAPVLVDADALGPADMGRGDAAALALRSAAHRSVLTRRRGLPVAVLGALPGRAGAPARLLASAGLPVTAAIADAAAVLVVSCGEPDRAAVDPLVLRRVPHQLLRAVEGELVVGPLVVPGHGACLRCLDAHHSIEDPLHPLLVSRHHRERRHDAVAEPLDSALVALALGWAVRDLVAHLDGEQAASRSATVRVTTDLADLSVVRWVPHPGCGCSWIAGSTPSATMEA